jgi:hypothetical protein
MPHLQCTVVWYTRAVADVVWGTSVMFLQCRSLPSTWAPSMLHLCSVMTHSMYSLKPRSLPHLQPNLFTAFN